MIDAKTGTVISQPPAPNLTQKYPSELFTLRSFTTLIDICYITKSYALCISSSRFIKYIHFHVTIGGNGAVLEDLKRRILETVFEAPSFCLIC